MLEEYEPAGEVPIETESFRKRLISDIRNSRVEFVYMCSDTSADNVVRDHSRNRPFSTYFIVACNVDSKALPGGNIMVAVSRQISAATKGVLVDHSHRYQVLTLE